MTDPQNEPEQPPAKRKPAQTKGARAIIPVKASLAASTQEDLPANIALAMEKNIKAAMEKNTGAAKSPATLRAYGVDWRGFESWCHQVNLTPMPASPPTVAAYITWLGEIGRRPSSIYRALVSITYFHRNEGVDPLPTKHTLVATTLKGIKRRFGTSQDQALPLLPEQLRAWLPLLPHHHFRTIQDRAILCLGLAGGFRRSELAGLTFDDVEFVPEGLIIHIRRPMTDQEGQGRHIGIPHGQFAMTNPVLAVQEWIKEGNITDGPLFRHIPARDIVTEKPIRSRVVCRVVKRLVRCAGEDFEKYSGHSLRSGFVTAATKAGKRLERIMDQTGHKSVQIVTEHQQDATLFEDNASFGIGL